MISITDDRETLIRQLFDGETFELMTEMTGFGDEWCEVLLKTNLHTTLEGELLIGVVSLHRGVIKYISENILVRRVKTSMRVW